MIRSYAPKVDGRTSDYFTVLYGAGGKRHRISPMPQGVQIGKLIAINGCKEGFTDIVRDGVRCRNILQKTRITAVYQERV